MNRASLCTARVIDPEIGPRLCAEQATAERWTATGPGENDRLFTTFCAEHTAEHDAKHPVPLGPPPSAARGGYGGDVDLFFGLVAPRKRGGAA